MQIGLHQESNLSENINNWIKESFKIEKFTCKKKDFSTKELNSLITQTRKQLQDLKDYKSEKSFENII